MATLVLPKSDASPEQSTGELYRELPQNLEAEQALLGALLIDNEALNHIADFLQSEYFFDPLHQDIFAAITQCYDKGQIANPITLKARFDKDERFSELGGAAYLARIAGLAGSIIDVKHYGRVIYDLAIKRDLIRLGGDVVNNAYDVQHDVAAASQIETAEQQLFQLATEGTSERGFERLNVSVAESLERAQAAWKNLGQVHGVTTGFQTLDRLLGGFQNSDLVIVAGRPSMGKTALATTMAYEACKKLKHEAQEKGEPEKSVGFFSLEMSAEQLAGRLLAGAAHINSSDIRRGKLDDDSFGRLVEQSNTLSELPFFIDDTPALSISALRTRARRLKRMHNLGLLIVDYLQLVRGSLTSGDNRVQEISEITQGLKAIAKELDIPVIALSQLSRAVEQREDKRPQLSDLRESGSIEQDSDVVMFVYREEYYLARKQPREGTDAHLRWQEDMEALHGVAEIVVAKQRHGPIGTAKLHFNQDTTHFSDPEYIDYGGDNAPPAF